MWTITIVFLVGLVLGYAVGRKTGWNAHVDYKLTEAIERAEETAERERR